MSTCTGTTKTVRTTRVETVTTCCCQTQHADRPERKTGAQGELRRLIEAGELRPGESLVWERPRKQETHHVTVNADGTVTPHGTDKRHSLSTAAEFFAQGSFNGWKAWRRARDGARLDRLRALMEHR
ncbi:hypothetical protein KIK06_09875 [Nocardiopsis sp. EMB25]|uniref:restriction system modified-DNA reader domain-containing protein n=1 Tax=Nocardiopsis sp. EMB25 TaxID=2835867 RepID=UPI002283C697|nr:hypothetical protein [Nocardiopsis sp. EMB25]MCY9784201.1 hypothetical protein [Nocardiopsis sp. EMB25]